MAVQTKEPILALLRNQHAPISTLGVKRLDLFGSFVRGQEDAGSDVDILVESAPECKTFDNVMQLAFFLEALFDRRGGLSRLNHSAPIWVRRSCVRLNMSGSTLAFLQHILNETQCLMDHAAGLTKAEFLGNETLQRAFARNLEIIGEVATQIPDDFRQ